jgi:hypothetical protein
MQYQSPLCDALDFTGEVEVASAVLGHKRVIGILSGQPFIHRFL